MKIFHFISFILLILLNDNLAQCLEPKLLLELDKSSYHGIQIDKNYLGVSRGNWPTICMQKSSFFERETFEEHVIAQEGEIVDYDCEIIEDGYFISVIHSQIPKISKLVGAKLELGVTPELNIIFSSEDEWLSKYDYHAEHVVFQTWEIDEKGDWDNQKKKS